MMTRPFLNSLLYRENLIVSVQDWRVNPFADPAHQPLADSRVGRRLKDLSVFVLQGGGRQETRVRDRAARSTWGAHSNYQAVSDRVLDDFRAILGAELFEDAPAIGADRFCAEG